MVKKILFILFCCCQLIGIAQIKYTPTVANLTNRQNFQDSKFGLFIHWGLSSVFASGEWVMQVQKIKKDDYKKYIKVFNPIDFDAEKWVLAAKSAGMKYVVFITRHHDGFSNWDTKFSDWKITNTPYAKDALQQLAAACKKHKMQLGLYYSLLDWFREDYPYETGRTGQHSGRTQKSNYDNYLQFMKNQLTELLTNYGDIMCIWFDGHWDQTNEEGNADRASRINWKYDELYEVIHKLQPACMIGNNHHLSPLPGEDFQMFERDLPGENKAGLSFQQPSNAMPLETCETMNDNWGYNITDHHYKSTVQIIHLLVGAAGRNTNLLLNVGPLPTGEIQTQFTDTLANVGKWLQQYGSTVYGTKGGGLAPQPWGVATKKEKTIYLHLLKKPEANIIIIPSFSEKIKSATVLDSGKKLKQRKTNGGIEIIHEYPQDVPIDYIIALTLQ
jgi:alpha-L-fucosidase